MSNINLLEERLNAITKASKDRSWATDVANVDTEEMEIGKLVTLVKRYPVQVMLGKVSKLLFSVEIKQNSINRKSRIGFNKKTEKHIIFSDKTATDWDIESQMIVMKAMKENNVFLIDGQYFAILILTHLNYNKPQKNGKLVISSSIKDVSNQEKNFCDMLNGVLYEDDQVNMNVESRYSKHIKPYEVTYQIKRKKKDGKYVMVESKVITKIATVKVYKVEPL